LTRTFNNILICLPTVSQSMMAGTALSVAYVVKALAANGINAELHNIDSAEIVTARDMFANMVLHSDRWDGLLFIDSDMAFDARLVLKLVDRGEDVTAAACPRRSLNIERMLSSLRISGNMPRAVAEASNFTVKFDWAESVTRPTEVQDGFCSVAAVGMAVALISRNCLIDMVEAEVVAPRFDLQTGGGKTCWSFFGVKEVEGHRYGEDYSFCHRWNADMGRAISVCIDEHVSHIGQFDYRARYSDLL
jgi:hypothetical protein